MNNLWALIIWKILQGVEKTRSADWSLEYFAWLPCYQSHDAAFSFLGVELHVMSHFSPSCNSFTMHVLLVSALSFVLWTTDYLSPIFLRKLSTIKKQHNEFFPWLNLSKQNEVKKTLFKAVKRIKSHENISN